MKIKPFEISIHMTIHSVIKSNIILTYLRYLQYGLTYTATDVSRVTDKEVCILRPPFFFNRTNRDLHSSETVKVYVFSNCACILNKIHMN